MATKKAEAATRAAGDRKIAAKKDVDRTVAGDRTLGAIAGDKLSDKAIRKAAVTGPKVKEAINDAKKDAKEVFGKKPKTEKAVRKTVAELGNGSSVPMTMKERKGLEREMKGHKAAQPAPQRSPIARIPRNEGGAATEAAFRRTTSEFQISHGDRREQLRQAAGRLIGKSSMFEDHPALAEGAPRGQIMHPCQTPGCAKLADYVHDAGVCQDCENKSAR